MDPTRSQVPRDPFNYEANGLRQRTVPELVTLHSSAALLQRNLLERHPGYPDALPVPFRDDPEFGDGAQFFMLLIAETVEGAGYKGILSREQQLLLGSTNVLNDWWMDETGSGEGEDGTRKYDKAIEAFDAVNSACYSYINPAYTDNDSSVVADPEIQRVVDYYEYVLDQMPENHRSQLARLLISINLYQGVTLYQEKDFRGVMGIGDIDLDGRNIGQDDLQMLYRMQIEKGGFMFSYLWSYFPELTDGIVIPNRRPTLEATLKRFLDGHSLYSDEGIGRRLREIGGVLQMMDDSFDRESDWESGMISPENVGPAYFERISEGWDEIVARTFRELAALMGPEYGEHHAIAVRASGVAVAGLTRFWAKKHGSKDF